MRDSVVGNGHQKVGYKRNNCLKRIIIKRMNWVQPLELPSSPWHLPSACAPPSHRPSSSHSKRRGRPDLALGPIRVPATYNLPVGMSVASGICHSNKKLTQHKFELDPLR